MEQNNSKTVFRPVRGLESKILATPAINGYVYFATDSKKIYLGENGKYISMGNSSGVYYGSKDFTQQDDPGDIVFSLVDLDTTTLPNVNDLIINVAGVASDGFYRVIEIISESEVRCSLIAVSTGGGGGGDSGSSGFAKIDRITLSPSETIINKDFFIEYVLSAQDSAGETITNPATATWRVNNRTVAEERIQVGRNKFKVDSFLDASRGMNTVTVSVSIDTGGSRNTVISKTWEIMAIDLRLEWNWRYSESTYIDSPTFTLYFKPYGGTDCTAHFIIDNAIGDTGAIYTMDISASESGQNLSKTLQSLPYGVHQVEMYLTAIIDGVEYQTNPIVHLLTFISGGTTPILTVPFFKTKATQYDTIVIPFLVYDPQNPECTVELWVNGTKVSADRYNQKLHEWAYMLDADGLNTFMLKASTDSYIEFSIQVASLDLDIRKPVGDIFSLQANKISGNDALKAWSLNGEPGLTFSDNFDWENGGLQTEIDEYGQIRKFIKVKNGTTMTINYNLFANKGETYGKEFKLIFKTTNCYDYDAQFLSCYDEHSSIGIRCRAQNTIISSTAKTLKTEYFEDSYIELEAEIWPYTDIENNTNYLMLWIDGVPSGVTVYTNQDTFSQTNPQPITIGSPDCDVNIYLVSVYEKWLNTNDHISNFILDAQSPKELIDRYNRNNILDQYGTISYEALSKQSGDCRIHLYDIPQMTTSKKDRIVCQYEQYQNSDIPVLKVKNARFHVQGTSSARYGVAAYNLDTEFGPRDKFPTPEMLDKDNQPLAGFAMTPNSIPVDYFCTKVNVASCEGINNAVNAEWYNRFQPYLDGHRRKNPMARDCMEFHPGIVFVKDHNKEIYNGLNEYGKCNVFGEIPGYVQNPSYRLYAIGCMGNSKKNIEVFHDTSNPRACCVEVCDNQTEKQWMNVPISLEDLTSKESFEFRYPDGNDEASLEMKQAWVDFVNWMAANNPNAHTDEPLPEPVSFLPYTFKGYAPPGYDVKSNKISIRGYTCKDYATRLSEVEEDHPYTNDTYEYRMAKMLSECEDHLVMDSVIYHYLFIERHTMVDNVAKNTFWSTEDLQHWDLTKNYDNDTADGNDNSGFMTLTYGYECLDKKKGTNSYVFNSAPATWLHFIHGLYGPCKELYQQLSNVPQADGETVSAWDPDNYLKLCQEFQNCIPERCWIEDYYRKYLRPRQLGLDQSKDPNTQQVDKDSPFLKRLEGGKKTHQRKQYELYQAQYLDSKYMTGSAQRLHVELRANTPDSYTGIVPVSVYADSYLWLEIGQIPYHKRVERGKVYNIDMDQLKLGNLNDATFYIFNAPMLQKINNLQHFYLKLISPGPATKLREIQIGDESPEYHNGNLTTADFSSNLMLEKVNVANCYNAEPEKNLGSLNFTNTVSLKDLRIGGSDYTEVAFAPHGLLEIAHLNDLSILKANQLNNLKEITFGSHIYDTLKTININGTPAINSYDLVLNSTHLTQYLLINMDWKITNNSLSTNNLQQLDILEHIKESKAKPAEGNTTATALTGSVLIDQVCNANEYDLYKKYHTLYPNLLINFSDKVTVEKASHVTFMSDISSSLDNKVYYSVLGNGIENLGFLTSKEGPTGIAIGNPSKLATDEVIFEFTNQWTDGLRTYSIEELNAIIPTNDKEWIFYPVYKEVPRKYHIKFCDKERIIFEQDLPWGATYTVPNFVNRDSSKLLDYQRWTFIGWSQIQYQDNVKPSKPQYLDLNNLKVHGNLTAYSHFMIEDARIIPTKNEYFVFEHGEYSNIIDNIPIKKTGYFISVKPEYRSILGGKITLPEKYENVPIIAIKDFRNVMNITHIFFEKPLESQYIVVSNDAFEINPDNALNTKLEQVNLPDSIKIIGASAFANQLNLSTITLSDNILSIGDSAFASTSPLINGSSKVIVNELPKELRYLGHQAFYAGSEHIRITRIPQQLKFIGQWCFWLDSNVCITDFNNNLKTIKNSAFYGCGENLKFDTIFVRANVTEIGKEAFTEYGGQKNGKIKNFYFENPEITYGEPGAAARFGIDPIVNTTFDFGG